MRAQPFMNDGQNAVADLFDVPRLIQQNDALWLAFCDSPVLLVYAAIEIITFALEPVLVSAVLANVTVVAAPGACQGGLERRKQQQRKVRLYVVAGCLVHRQDTLYAQPAAGALIGLGGVCVAIAEHDLTSFERRKNDLVERLRAVRKHQGHLGSGRNLAQLRLAFGIQQHAADPVAKPGSTGLTKADYPMSFSFKRCREIAKLSGFACSIQALKRDEKSGSHALSLLHESAGRLRRLNAHLMD